MFAMTDSDNNWIYKSLCNYTTFYEPMLWLNTPYPAEGVGFDFNHYINYVANESMDDVPSTLNVTPASSVKALFVFDVLPVFIHLRNSVEPDYWQGFVLQNTFITSLLQPQPHQYSIFCTSKPDTQPGLLCPVSYYPPTLQECNLRYGSLSEDGSTVTWNGDCGLVVEQTSSDNLDVRLLPDAPDDWVITEVTSEDDGWHVYLTGSATPSV